MESLEIFDRRFVFSSDTRKTTSDKSRRDHFKKLISGIIGVSFNIIITFNN